MNTIRNLTFTLLFLLVFLVGCSFESVEPDSPVSHGNEIGGYVEFVDTLRSSGAQVEPTGSIEQSFIPVEGQVIEVNGKRVEVYEFEENEARQKFSEQISSDGSKFGSNNEQTVVDWVDQPNFWAQDRLLVLYVGRDQETIDMLTKILGNPITEHPVVSQPDPPYAVIAAEQMLSDELSLSVDEIDYVAYERTDWPDACLGFADKGEMCAEVITPGWKIILEAEGQNYEFHTDQNGETLRWQPLDEKGGAGSVEDGSDTVDLANLKISLDIDSALASGFTQEIVTAPLLSESTPVWEAYPDHIEIQLENYALDESFHDARVYIYPILGIEVNNEYAAKVINQLREILEQRPLLEMRDGNLPFLPIFNAAQVFHAWPEYWAFENGMGIRFLTQYSQAEVPINNYELFYTFQGMTNDGDFYVVAILPVSHPDLTKDASIRQMDDLNESRFEPNLMLIDHMIRSITINNREG